MTYEDLKKVKKVLSALGFNEKNGCFFRSDCPWFIEFVSPPVAIGGETVRDFASVSMPTGTVKMLSPLDCIKDRLAAYYHWNDLQSLDQALDVAVEIIPLDLGIIEQWSIKEGQSKKYAEFASRYESLKKKTI